MKTKKRYQEMTGPELAEATKEFNKPWTEPGLPGKPLTVKERAKFEAWQEKALAEEAMEKKERSLTLVFPEKLFSQIGKLAKAKHTTPANLVKRLVQDAIHQAVA